VRKVKLTWSQAFHVDSLLGTQPFALSASPFTSRTALSFDQSALAWEDLLRICFNTSISFFDHIRSKALVFFQERMLFKPSSPARHCVTVLNGRSRWPMRASV
jgi:hypothetical protein